MELSYQGVKAGDYVMVIDVSVSQNTDGWGRDLPRRPWNEEVYTEKRDYGKVLLKSGDGWAELYFANSGKKWGTFESGWSRPLRSFKTVMKVDEETVCLKHEAAWATHGASTRREERHYEKDSDGNEVPLGTAKRKWVEANK